jgi:hypothetical protein
LKRKEEEEEKLKNGNEKVFFLVFNFFLLFFKFVEFEFFSIKLMKISDFVLILIAKGEGNKREKNLMRKWGRSQMMSINFREELSHPKITVF